MNSWFTPTVLFLLLNLMIGTIALTSSLTNQSTTAKQPNSDPNTPTKLLRSPSVLQRIKSINFHTHFNRSPEQQSHKPPPDSDSHLTQTVESHSHYFFPPPETTPPVQQHYTFDQETQTQFTFDQRLDFDEKIDEEEEEMQSMDQVYSQLKGNRTKSDTKPASGQIPVKLPKKMKKSASSKSAFGHFEAAEIVEARRPATVREKGVAKIAEGDEEVDAKADDFINKFKQQLKLQRLDSIIRYKDMIGRGSGATR